MISFFSKYGHYFAFGLIALWLIGIFSQYLNDEEVNWFNFIRQVGILIIFWEFMSISLKSLFNYENQIPLWYKILKDLTPKQRISRGAIAIVMAFIMIAIAAYNNFLFFVLLPIYPLLLLLGISLTNTKLVNWQLSNVKTVSTILAYYIIFSLVFLAVIFILGLTLGD